jgi:hypothetical protein
VIPLVVGCPVAHRAWVLDAWFDHVEDACEVVGIEPTYAFVVDQGDICTEIIERRAQKHLAIEFVARSKGTDARRWDPKRFTYMVEIRNRLLALVRDIGPARFLSVDSDILVHRHLLQSLMADLDDDGDYAAVGGKCYMTATGVKFPSWGRISRQGSLQRYDAHSYFPCDVIMAIKLMGPSAYHVDYEFDLQGEDIGWCKACTRNGLRLAWDGRLASKHLLSPSMMGRLDARIGW